MINWRKPMMDIAFRMKGQSTFKYLKYLRAIESKPAEEMTQLQHEKLRRLLKHACENIPYYNKILPWVGVLDNGHVNLDNFYKIPVLTKDIIRREGKNLYSKDSLKRGAYFNTSGGSTGEPVKLVQDKEYLSWNHACRLLFNIWAGKDAGEREIKLWGSERDILEGAEKILTKLQQWGFNLILLNSFAMSDDVMAQYVKSWNRHKPKMVWAYASSIHEFAKYIKRRGIRIFNPASIVCTAETLTETVREYIENVFCCPVLNQYGSREVGAIACECPKREGLHTFALHNKIEILDDDLEPCPPGQMGNVYVTTLNNYSMPLIRYKIGDTAVVSEKRHCSCGRSWPLIGAITGRISDHFRTQTGKLVHGEYFTHLFYENDEVRRFRVIQHAYDDIEVEIEPIGKIRIETFESMKKKMKIAMGKQCKIRFNEVRNIPRLPSGKHRYTISKVSAAFVKRR